MSLFYAHPFSSYCQKVLIALYESNIPFFASHFKRRKSGSRSPTGSALASEAISASRRR
jgi:glutathione S-transferase